LSYICPSVLHKNLRVFVELFAKKILSKFVSAYGVWSKEFEKNFIFNKSAGFFLRICSVIFDTDYTDLEDSVKRTAWSVEGIGKEVKNE
jgi:hypothetical protein